MYACVLVDESNQSFEVLQSELTEGRLLGNMIGGDTVLRQALNIMSDRFWKQQEDTIQSFHDIVNQCEKNPVIE